MEFLNILQLILNHGPELVGYIVLALGAMISFFMLLPGPQPEQFLQSIVDFLSKFSKK